MSEEQVTVVACFFLLIRLELENKVKFCYDNNTLVILLVSDSNNSIMKVSGGDTFWKWNISMIILLR